MGKINYSELHMVYNRHLYSLPPAGQEPEPPPPPPVEEKEEEVFYEVRHIEAKPEPTYSLQPEPMPMQMQSVVHDPVREMVSAALPFAVGVAIWNFLTSGPKTRVGNQSITDMSNERVAEYRRRGLLD